VVIVSAFTNLIRGRKKPLTNTGESTADQQPCSISPLKLGGSTRFKVSSCYSDGLMNDALQWSDNASFGLIEGIVPTEKGRGGNKTGETEDDTVQSDARRGTSL
jgi:hypothetical protein